MNISKNHIYKKLAAGLLAVSLILSAPFNGEVHNTVYAAKTKTIKKKIVLIKGESKVLKIKGKKSKIRWKSSNPKKVSVNKKGKIKAKKKGKAVIRAKYKNKNYQFKVTVETPKLSRSSAVLTKGNQIALKLKGCSIKTKWTSNNKNVASVSSKGVVRANKKGTAVITAKVRKFTYRCRITVNDNTKTNGNAGNTTQPKPQENAKGAFDYGKKISEELHEAVKEYEDEDGYTIPGKEDIIDRKVIEYAKKLIKDKKILKYLYNEKWHTVTFVFPDGGLMVYEPSYEGTLAGGNDTTFTVASLDNAKIDLFALESTNAKTAALSIAKLEQYESYTIDEKSSNINAVSNLIKNADKYRVIFWRGHGISPVYRENPQTKKQEEITGFVIPGSESDIKNNWYKDYQENRIIFTKGMKPVITPYFFEKYMPKSKGGLFYSGTCYGGADGGKMADAILSKGFDTYVGADNSVNCGYSSDLMKSVADHLKDKEANGDFVTIDKAFKKATGLLRSTDYMSFKAHFRLFQNKDDYFRLVPTQVTIVGKILDYNTREPLENVTVTIQNPKDKDDTQTATTTENGMYEIRNVGEGYRELTLEKKGYVSQNYSFQTDQYILPGEKIVTLNDYYLYKDTSVSGMIVEKSDEEPPIKGVKVTLEIGNKSWSQSTDEKGEYSFVGIPEGKGVLKAEKEGYEAVVYSLGNVRGQKKPETLKLVKSAGLTNPVIKADSKMDSGQNVTWSCIYFGQYPQTEIVNTASRCGTFGQSWGKESDYEVNTKLYMDLSGASWTNNETVIDDIRYRRIKSTDTSDITDEADVGYYNWSDRTSYHYFRYEKIKWRVLNTADNKAFLLADSVLDDQWYHQNESKSVNWGNSTIRSWLNAYQSSSNSCGIDYSRDGFMKKAFSQEEQDKIILTGLNNSTTGEFSATYGGANTVDKIFLLSSYDVYHTSNAASYGFVKNPEIEDEARRALSSTFAKAMGVCDISGRNIGYCDWWLRSPGNGADNEGPCAAAVFNDGDVDPEGDFLNSPYYGVRPAINLDLSDSSLWEYAGTVSSGDAINSGINISQAKCIFNQLQYLYTGEVVLPDITLSYKGTTLKEGEDYSITSSSIEPGNAVAKVSGKGKYSGSISLRYQITASKYSFEFVNLKTLVAGKKALVAAQLYEIYGNVEEAEEESAIVTWSLDDSSAASFKTIPLGRMHYIYMEPQKPGKFVLTATFSDGTKQEQDIEIEPEMKISFGAKLNNGELDEIDELTSYTDVWCEAELDSSKPDSVYLKQFIDNITYDKDSLADIVRITAVERKVSDDGCRAWVKLRVGHHDQRNVEKAVFTFHSPGGLTAQKTLNVRKDLIASLNYRANGGKWDNNDGSHAFLFSDSFFFRGTQDYQNDLAVMSLGLEMASHTSHSFKSKYTKENVPRQKNLREAFDKLHFRNPVFYKYDRALSDYEDQAAFGIASKTITTEDKSDTLIAVAIRGGGYGAEWASNFHIGNDGKDAIGFRNSANRVAEELRSYIQELKENRNYTGDIKIWIVGYSRAAAIANLLGHSINQGALGNEFGKKNVYVYTFATPSGQRGDDHSDTNIYNIVSASDFVPRLALKEGWGFSKYGITKTIPGCYQNNSVKNSYKNYTGDNLNVEDIADDISEFMYSFSVLLPDTDKYVGMAQEEILAAYRRNYSEKESAVSIVVSLVEGLLKSPAVVGKVMAGPEFINEWETANDSGDYDKAMDLVKEHLLLQALNTASGAADEASENKDPELGAALNLIDSVKVLLKIKKLSSLLHSHHVEHYLAWLESGGIMTMDEDTYANLADDDRERIDAGIESVYSSTLAKRYEVACPVDVQVTDASGTLVASVVGNEVKKADIPCYVKEDKKIIYLPEGGTYHFKLTGTDVGKMDYTVKEYSEEYSLLRKVKYVDVDLTPGIVYEGDVTGQVENVDETYSLTSGSVTTEPSLDTLRDVEKQSYTLTIKNGTENEVYRTGLEGEGVEISAEERDNDPFVQWITEDQDTLIENSKEADTICRMPGHDTTVTAHFVSDHQWDEQYVTDFEPTDKKPGQKSIHCKLCGAIKEGTETEIPVKEEPAEQEITLQNPRIEVDNSMSAGQKVTWDCIWFGEYPQTEIVDKPETCGASGKSWSSDSDYDVDPSLYNTLVNSNEWDSNGDLTVNGIKYRRLKKSDANFTGRVPESCYTWSDSIPYHYFRYEKIKWRVLDISDGQVLVLADQPLDDINYCSGSRYTWKVSRARSWLNGYGALENGSGEDYSNNSFIKYAFSASEQEAILTTQLQNESIPGSITSGGDSTNDKIFLLSSCEVSTNSANLYGFVSNPNTYDEARICKSTTYAKARGSYTSTFANGSCGWWLRTPGTGQGMIVYIWAYVNYSGKYPINESSVRPAMKLNISSDDLWTYAGTVCSDSIVIAQNN